MNKKALLTLLFTLPALFMGLQSCNTNNPNPTVPAPLPTNTSTFTATPTVTNTFTATPTGTPVACNTQVVTSEIPVATTTVAANYTYADQFNLTPASDFESVTVVIAGASVTGTGTNLEIALYTDASGYPGNVLFISGPHNFTSTGPATYIFNPATFSLPAGAYWLAIHCPFQYNPNKDTSDTTTPTYMTSGRFPSPFPAGAPTGGSPWSYTLDTCHP